MPPQAGRVPFFGFPLTAGQKRTINISSATVSRWLMKVRDAGAETCLISQKIICRAFQIMFMSLQSICKPFQIIKIAFQIMCKALHILKMRKKIKNTLPPGAG
jgi:hypothetical protein